MSTQRIVQLLISFVLITAIAVVSERSHVLASIVSAMPVKLALALWFIFSDSGGDRLLSADFCRISILALIPTMLFLGACWFALKRGWTLPQVIGLGYVVWLLAVGVYRGIEWWIKSLVRTA
jgi:uncharacterized membrane protein (GlpM family)